jgi:subtilisin family serine protease
MLTLRTIQSFAGLALYSAFLIPLAWTQTPASEYAPGSLLVKPADKVSDATIARVLAGIGGKVHHKLDPINVLVVEVPEKALDRVQEALAKTGIFTFVERDFVAHPMTTPNDPDFVTEWHLAKIQAPGAWSLTLGSSNVPIAIIDSGADSTHPDLKPKLLPGWSFLTGTSNTSDTGCSGGHGTAVSGAAAAATNNLTGVAGVGWANPIMPLVVLSSTGVAQYSNIASAITYAADHGVRIISISIGGSTASSTLQSAVDYAWNKGAVVFAAAGNSSSTTPIYPAACNNALAISATDQSDSLASFSNYGNWIKLSSPGNSILTTTMGGGYGSWYGTSLATPVAAAVGALALSANPSLTASALVSLLEKNTDDLGAPGFDNYFGWGRVNAYKAVAAAQGVSTDKTLPTVSIISPLSGTSVWGTVSISGTSSDNVGVTKVELYVDGVLSGTGASAAFSFTWNSTTKANGSHTMLVKAYDAAGNVGSASVGVTVNNADTTAPKVSIGSPLSGATVSGTVLVTGTASDNVGISKVELYVDGALYASSTSAVFSFSWNSTTKANGSHTLAVKAYDKSGNTASASVAVNVSNTTSSTAQPLLLLHGDASEVSAVTNGSTVTPSVGPAGFTGKVVANGTGAVRFSAAQMGNGVYFSNCCTNTNNAYYKFLGTTVGNVFNINQGKITFYLKSRYSFSQRQTSAAAPRYTFAVRDGNNQRPFFFLTQITSGRLQFTWATGGSAQYYLVPLGTENALFGPSVTLKVTLSWNGSLASLYLNDKLVKSAAYNKLTPSWSSASLFDLGANEYLTYGGYNVSDDIIDEFTVN